MNELMVKTLKPLRGGIARPTSRPLAGMVGCCFASLLLITVARAAATNIVHHVNPAEAQKLIAEKKVVVLDVRTPKEFAAGHIAGAQNISVEAADFGSRISSLDKTAAYFLYCRSGRRSAIAADQMAAAGFSDVVDAGAMADLAAAGAPLE